MTSTFTPSIRRNHERRNPEVQTVEDLIRDGHLLLEAVGVSRSPSWMSRIAREYLASPIRNLPWGLYLATRHLTAVERRRLAERDDLRYLLVYADPAGETAIRNVDRSRR